MTDLEGLLKRWKLSYNYVVAILQGRARVFDSFRLSDMARHFGSSCHPSINIINVLLMKIREKLTDGWNFHMTGSLIPSVHRRTRHR